MTICLMLRDTSPPHRVDQAVDCGLTPLQWLCEVPGYWRELEHAVVHVDPEHPNTEYRYADGHRHLKTSRFMDQKTSQYLG